MSKKKDIVENDGILEDNLSSLIIESLNKKFKDIGQIAYFLGEDDDPSSIIEWISTGCDSLDINISNRKDGGLPVGRLTEISGMESSGKTLMAAHILASTQKKGGLAIFIESENSLDNTFLNAVGVDTNKSKFVHIALDAIEDILATIESVIVKVRESDKDKLVTIVVDSIAAATTKTELATDYDKAGYNTTKAIVLSQGLRKLMPMIAKQRICLVFINQLRSKVGVLTPGADPYTTPGGKAIPFHASVRIRLKTKGKIKAPINDVDTVVGVKSEAEVVKNKLGPSYRKTEFNIFYDSGIDNYGSWLETCKKYGVVTTAGAIYTMIDDTTGEVLAKFRSKEWNKMLKDDKEFRDRVYNIMADKLIMNYKVSDTFGIDDIQTDTSDPVAD